MYVNIESQYQLLSERKLRLTRDIIEGHRLTKPSPNKWLAPVVEYWRFVMNKLIRNCMSTRIDVDVRRYLEWKNIYPLNNIRFNDISTSKFIEYSLNTLDCCSYNLHRRSEKSDAPSVRLEANVSKKDTRIEVAETMIR